MSNLTQTRYIRRRLESLDRDIAAARNRASADDPAQRIDARGDLEVLARRRAVLAQRLGEIEAGVDTAWERAGAEFEQDVAILEDDLKRWMDRLDG